MGVAFLLLLVFRIKRGITMKCGIAGPVLILMPHFFAIFQNPVDRMFNRSLAVTNINANTTASISAS